MSERRRDGLMLAVLLALILLFVGPALLPGRVLLPLDIVSTLWPPWQDAGEPAAVHNALLSDPVAYMVPIRQFASDAVRRGEWPLWNPTTLAGSPFTYNTQAGLYYPLSVLFYLLPLPTAWDAVIIIQMALGGVFMLAYLRSLGLRRMAALAGAVVFLFNGVMVVWLEWQVVHAAVIWLPLQLWLVETMRARLLADNWRAARRAAVWLGIAVALPWLNGHWNWTLYLSLILGSYLVLRLAMPPVATSSRRRVALALLPIAIGIGLALIQLLPAVTYLAQSHRVPFTWAEAQARGIGRIAAILFVPTVYGTPLDNVWRGPETLNFNEATAYVGILPVLLALLGAWLRRRDGVTRFWAAWALLGGLWTLGTPAYRLLHALPVFDGLFPSRAAIVLTVSVSVLAAVGLDRALAQRVDGRRVAVGGGAAMVLTVASAAGVIRPNFALLRADLSVFAILLVGSVYLLWAVSRGRLNRSTFAALTLVWIVIDLFMAGIDYNTIGHVDDFYPPTPVGAFLQGQPDALRIASLPRGEAYPPNASIMAGVENVSGYEPGILQRVVDYMDAAEGGPTIRFDRKLLPLNAIDSPLLDALNVRYTVTIDDRFSAESQPVFTLDPTDNWYTATDGVPVGQQLTLPSAGLQRIDLHMRGVGATVTLRVLSQDAAYEFAHATIDVIPRDNDTPSFFFAPFPAEWGRDFYLSLETSEPIEFARADDGRMALTAYALQRPDLAFEAGKTRVYANDGAFARAWTVGQAVAADSAESALALVLQNQNALDQRVILEPDGQPLPALPASSDSPGTVTITQRGLNRVQLQAEMTRDGFVVLSDTYYAGWRTTLDGARVPLYRANSIMRAVFVPAGAHTIDMVFRPNDFLVGAAVSALTLTGVGAFLLLDAVATRKERVLR